MYRKLLIILLISVSLHFPVFAAQQVDKIDTEAVQRFGMAVSEIKRLYVNQLTDKAIFNFAIAGILAGLDPHSMYLNEEAFKELSMQTSGEFVGIGIEITQEKGMVKVISPIDDTPAAQAGIKAGDYILAIDNKPLIEVSLPEVAQRLRGNKGEKVKLTIIRKKEKKPRQIILKRDLIRVQSVKSKLLEKGFGYIRITHFQETTATTLEQAIQSLKKQSNGQLNGLILDLRNNPGGLLDSGIEVADLFLDHQKLKHKKSIVSIKGRVDEMNKTFYSSSPDIIYGTPLIILINEGSASASEIVAGALQDHKRAIIMGERSFGKGSVQTIFQLDKSTGIKLTTGLYYTPNGRSIQAKGIQPDIVVDNLKIQKPKEEIAFLWPIRENDIDGHFENETSMFGKQPTKAEKEQLLATSDYQLNTALQLLKSLNLLKQ
ncbi:MAG: hypothetical protein A3C55_06315 [Gammaproteobacteria bacterium RIFCSPHIGHO2_02_FULL_42_13]|nr:MAG: hypothetical protein A3C55_06315 [Gammaproteobacteria bacterium RIFCSPHIGHO2_02_FULL_42_13]OGT70437.1 MAG: hypothetical protein A3H43_06015 [Gammaproteobacteria bacterium RIFCSPLOWO2_02_FULL_42_9]